MRALFALLFLATTAWAQPTTGGARLLLKDHTTPLARILSLDCEGTGVTCSNFGTDGTITVTGGGVPAAHNFLDALSHNNTAGSGTPARGDLITAQTATPTWRSLTIDTTPTRYLANTGGGEPQWDTVNLSTGVSNALNPNHGGTGIASGISGGILGFTSPTNIASSIALTLNALIVGGGPGATPTPSPCSVSGTAIAGCSLSGNASTATQFATNPGQCANTNQCVGGGIQVNGAPVACVTPLLANSLSQNALVKLNSGASNQATAASNCVENTPGVLTGCTAVPSAGSHNLLSSAHTDTVAASPPVTGDIPVGNQNTLWEKRPVGADQQVVMAGLKPGTGTVTTSGGVPDTVVTGVDSVSGTATIFQTELQVGDSITLFGHDGTTQTSTVSLISSQTVLNVNPGFNPRLTQVGFAITSRFGLQWQNRGGPEAAFFRVPNQPYLAGSLTLLRSTATDGGSSMQLATVDPATGNQRTVFMPYFTARRGTITFVGYVLTSNGNAICKNGTNPGAVCPNGTECTGGGTCARSRCRIGIYDSDNPPNAVFPRHRLYSETVNTGDQDVTAQGCPLAQAGICAGGPGAVGLTCSGELDCCPSPPCTCSPSCCTLKPEAFCAVSRIIPTPVSVLPGQLYWIAVQCNGDKACSASAPFPHKTCTTDADCTPSGACTGCCAGTTTVSQVRALSPGGAVAVYGYDPATDAGLTHFYAVLPPSYTGTLLNEYGINNTFAEAGRVPEMMVSLQ